MAVSDIECLNNGLLQTGIQTSKTAPNFKETFKKNIFCSSQVEQRPRACVHIMFLILAPAELFVLLIFLSMRTECNAARCLSSDHFGFFQCGCSECFELKISTFQKDDEVVTAALFHETIHILERSGLCHPGNKEKSLSLLCFLELIQKTDKSVCRRRLSAH